MESSFLLLRAFWPPDLDPEYLTALAGPVLETITLAFGAMTLAFLASLPLGIAVGMRMRGARALVSALAVFRAVPDLTLAILCVVLFGLGPGAGLIALFLYYTAAVAKVFADLLDTAPEEPLEALAATGASPMQVACFGMISLRRDELMSYGIFAFECALRASVVVGAVGGGGIGAELAGTLAAMDLGRATTLILLLVMLMAVLDRFAIWLRAHPRVLLVLLPLGLLCAAFNAPQLLMTGHALRVFSEMVPPVLGHDALAMLPRLVWETVWIAVAGTVVAGVVGLGAAIVASYRLGYAILRWPMRRLLELLRAVPELIWGLVLVAAVGVGPLAGAWALGIHSLGSLGKLFADVLDSVPEQPQRAIASTGAGRIAVACYATIPLAAGPIATHLLFRLEWNMRMAAVLGLIGAGGVGQALYEAQQLFFYREALAWVCVTAILVLATDRLSIWLRSRIRMPFSVRSGDLHCIVRNGADAFPPDPHLQPQR